MLNYKTQTPCPSLSGEDWEVFFRTLEGDTAEDEQRDIEDRASDAEP
jgi:hypothetical protein